MLPEHSDSVDAAGHIFQINMFSGDVLKMPTRQAEVIEMDLVGDMHTHNRVHGGVDRALFERR
jgi:MOSC domain-containing protein YiiM